MSLGVEVSAEDEIVLMRAAGDMEREEGHAINMISKNDGS